MNHIRNIMTERAMGESVAFGISVRGWIVMTLIGTVCYMGVKQIDVKEPLYSLALIGSGYYFGRIGTQRPNAQRPDQPTP